MKKKLLKPIPLNTPKHPLDYVSLFILLTCCLGALPTYFLPLKSLVSATIGLGNTFEALPLNITQSLFTVFGTYPQRPQKHCAIPWSDFGRH